MLPGLLFCKEKKNARIGEYGAARARQSPEGFALKAKKRASIEARITKLKQ